MTLPDDADPFGEVPGDEESPVLAQLREAYNERRREAASLREEVEALRAFKARHEQDRFDEVCSAAGLPDGLRPLVRQVLEGLPEDERNVSVDGLQEWMRANRVMTEVDVEQHHRTAATQRIAELRASSTPVGTQTMGYAEYQALKLSNPRQAADLSQRGLVDFPPQVLQAILSNRAERDNNPLLGT